MELLTLDSDFQPIDLVENYESLIWTERYSKAGDFQLTSTSIAKTIAALPTETCVTLRDSTVPMLIEFHKIEKKKGETPKLTVLGRSYEACALERRASVKEPLGATTKSAWVLNAAKESDAAYLAIRTVIGDIDRYQSDVLVLSSVPAAVSPTNDPIPQIDLTLPADYGVAPWVSTKYYMQNDLVSYGGNYYLATSLTGNLNQVPTSSPTYWTSTTSTKAYEIKTGDLYTTVKDLIVANNRGIKSVRPDQNGTKIGVEIYNGADRTATVVFDARFDQFDDATYLLGAQGSANVAYVYGYLGSQLVLKTVAAEPSGMDRRVLALDETSDQTTNNSDVRRTRGLVELYKNNATALFDGEVAQQVAEGYNRNYFLGDILKLTGEYGLSQNVRVAEFIRSADAQGEKAYPTFEAVI
jgi:hypothetical protein